MWLFECLIVLIGTFMFVRYCDYVVLDLISLGCDFVVLLDLYCLLVVVVGFGGFACFRLA